VEEINTYTRWPKPEWWDYSKVKQDCAKWHPKYFVLNKGDRLDRTAQLKPMMYMRGIQQTFIDLARTPKSLSVFATTSSTIFVNYNPKVFEAGASEMDMFMMGDEYGRPARSLVGPAMWKRYFAERVQEILRYCPQIQIEGDVPHLWGCLRPHTPDD